MMADFKLRGYSCPQAELDKFLLDRIASVHTREILQRFLSRYSARLCRRGQGIVEMLNHWVHDGGDFSLVWDSAFAYCHAAVLSTDCQNPTNVAAAVAIRLASRGISCKWHLRLEDPTMRLRWDRWLLPEAEQIAVESDGQSADIRTRIGTCTALVRLTRAGEGWIGEGADRIVTVGRSHAPIILLTQTSVSPWETFQLPTEVEDRVDSSFENACQSAIGIMRDYAPSYLAWVERTVRHMVVLKQHVDGDYNYSGSSSGDYGLIHVSAACDPICLAEILVHEAAHQYFYILCRLGPVDDGTDQNLYYSPLVRTNRRIDRILLAYHAVANIVLLARVLRTNNAPPSAAFARQQEKALLEELQQLEKPLVDNRALTPVGRAILDPLVEQFHRNT